MSLTWSTAGLWVSSQACSHASTYWYNPMRAFFTDCYCFLQGQAALKSLSWMRLMKCFPEVSKIKFMMSSEHWTLRSRSSCCLLLCPRMCWKLPHASWGNPSVSLWKRRNLPLKVCVTYLVFQQFLFWLGDSISSSFAPLIINLVKAVISYLASILHHI